MTQPETTVIIGNVYGHGFDSAMVAEVESLGFSIRPGLGRFPGGQVMRFVEFARGPALELSYVEDPKAYADFVPKGMVPYCPGISLLLPQAGPDDLVAFEERFARLRPSRYHVNYDGSQDPGKPGWTYLNFATPLVRDTFIYLTVRDEPRPATTKLTDHPNRVQRVRGLWFDMESRELRDLADVVGAKAAHGTFSIGDTMVWSRESFPDRLGSKEKRFPLQTMVLEAGDLAHTSLRDRDLTPATFGPQPALRYETNPLSWDLLFVGAAGNPP